MTTARVPSTFTALKTASLARANHRGTVDDEIGRLEGRRETGSTKGGLDATHSSRQFLGVAGPDDRPDFPAGIAERLAQMPADEPGCAGDANRPAFHTTDRSSTGGRRAASMPALTASLSSSVHDNSPRRSRAPSPAVTLRDQQRIEADATHLGQHAEQQQPGLD